MGKIFVIGKDKRQETIRTLYKKEGKLANNIEDAKYILLPTPLTIDLKNITGEDILLEEIVEFAKNKTVFAGKIPKNVRRNLEINNIEYYDLMEFDELAIKNAIPTAEGTIAKIMELTNTTIFNSNILILGFGKCGKILADRLAGLRANVFCEARKSKDLAQIKAMRYNCVDLVEMEEILPNMDIVINTVPFMLLNRRRLDLLKQDVLIIDIASAPGGTDFDYCKEKNINAILELGIPSKVAPVSASKYIKEIIDKLIGG
ncbi:MAG: dipicolinate synthase subunit DpsA [Clostridia bacterium]|nr:dipicolinate synthase subunit DpsA [Clostridia bacterium]